MASSVRKFIESPLRQGVDEQIAYKLNTDNWGGSPNSPTVVIKNADTEVDLSGTNLSGSSSINGTVITTPTVIDLEEGVHYRLEIQWTTTGTYSGNVLETYGIIIGEL